MTENPRVLPSPSQWVQNQVDAIEQAGTTDAATIMDRPVVLLTMTGAKTGALRKVPLMRVEDKGVYAAFGSKGGAPDDPQWVRNLTANPLLTVQDGSTVHEVRARLISGDERQRWWERGVAAFPPYAEYQTKTDREIPIFLLEPR